jgi:hypothetical protein
MLLLRDWPTLDASMDLNEIFARCQAIRHLNREIRIAASFMNAPHH